MVRFFQYKHIFFLLFQRCWKTSNTAQTSLSTWNLFAKSQDPWHPTPKTSTFLWLTYLLGHCA